MIPRVCGRFQSCCTDKVDVIDYYNEEIQILESQYQREIIKAYENKIGVAFITFETVEDARKFVKKFISIYFEY